MYSIKGLQETRQYIGRSTSCQTRLRPPYCPMRSWRISQSVPEDEGEGLGFLEVFPWVL
jgi:hypothetical protein